MIARVLGCLGIAVGGLVSTMMAGAQAPAYPDRQVSFIIPAAAAAVPTLRCGSSQRTWPTISASPLWWRTSPAPPDSSRSTRRAAQHPMGYTIIGISDVTLIYLPLLLKAANSMR